MLHGVIVVSVIFGIITAVFVFFVFLILLSEIALPMAIFSGAFSSLLISVIGWISLTADNKKFASVEKLLQNHNIYCKTDGARYMGNKLTAGKIYFCENEILFIHFKGKRHTVETISPDNIHKTEFIKNNFRFHIASDEMYTVIITKEISDTLKDKYNVV